MGAVEGQERRLLAFNGYGNEDGSEVSVVQVHPDPESMLFHMQVAAEHIERATEELRRRRERRMRWQSRLR